VLNHHTSPGRSPFDSPHGGSDLMARQRDAFGTSEEHVRGLNLDRAGATRHFAARCVTWSAGSLQPRIAPMRDEFRPRTGEERKAMAPEKNVIVSLPPPSVTKVSPNAIFTSAFSTASKPRNRKAAECKLQKWARATPPFGLSSAQMVLRGRSRPLILPTLLWESDSGAGATDFACANY